MDKDGYEYKGSESDVILLLLDGKVPDGGITISCGAEFDGFVSTIDKVWRKADSVEGNLGAVHQRPTLPNITEAEILRAQEQWVGGHYTFLLIYPLLAHAYQMAYSAVLNKQNRELVEWSEYVVALWHCAGALLDYCVDFTPTMQIYCKYIRSRMPEAFSGFWARESWVVRKAYLAWNRLPKTSTSPEFLMADEKIKAAHQVYREYHTAVMERSVPDGKSLAEIYREQKRCPHAVTGAEFEVFDDQFGIIRRDHLTKAEFIRLACDVFQHTLVVIETGSGLSSATIKDLCRGFRTSVQIFGHWLGPIPPYSQFHPETFR